MQHYIINIFIPYLGFDYANVGVKHDHQKVLKFSIINNIIKIIGFTSFKDLVSADQNNNIKTKDIYCSILNTTLGVLLTISGDLIHDFD